MYSNVIIPLNIRVIKIKSFFLGRGASILLVGCEYLSYRAQDFFVLVYNSTPKRRLAVFFLSGNYIFYVLIAKTLKIMKVGFIQQ